MTPTALDEIVNRTVSLEELRRALEDPIPTDERDDILALRRWFMTRYRDAGARLAYVRQAHARWRSGGINSARC